MASAAVDVVPVTSMGMSLSSVVHFRSLFLCGSSVVPLWAPDDPAYGVDDAVVDAVTIYRECIDSNWPLVTVVRFVQ